MTTVLDRPTSGERATPTPNLPSTPTRTRLPVLLLGLLIVLGSGIGFAVWSTDLDERESVLVANRDIRAGDVITASDFRTHDLGGAADVQSISVANAALFHGTTAVADIVEGTVVNSHQFTETSGLRPGEAVVGMLLDAGANPVPRLRVGDVVQVVRTSTDRQPAAVIADATVHAVRTAGPVSDAVTVSLVVPADRAVDVADAAAAGRIRLVLVPGRAG